MLVLNSGLARPQFQLERFGQHGAKLVWPPRPQSAPSPRAESIEAAAPPEKHNRRKLTEPSRPNDTEPLAVSDNVPTCRSYAEIAFNTDTKLEERRERLNPGGHSR